MRKAISVMLLSLLCCMLPGMSAQAKTTITEENFDYGWYLEQHPDVEAAIGTDRDAVWNFYVTVGEPAGWMGRVSPEWYAEAYFDAARYAADNPDVAQALGTDAGVLWQHYKNVGKAEGRKVSSTIGDVNAVLTVYNVLGEITDASMTQSQKVTAMHDWVCGHTVYDYESYSSGEIPPSSSTLLGLLETGRSVCEGYAVTMEAFLDAAGIKNEVISGMVDNGVSKGLHAWNAVWIGGQWLYVDCTWDDFDEYNCIVHECCLISEAEMNRIHDGCVMYFSYDGRPIGYRKRT